MKNVLYIVSTLQRSGPINIVYNIIEEIDRTKFAPILLCLSPESKNKISALNEFRDLNVEIHSLGLTRLKGFLLGRAKISRFCKKMNIQIIHLVGLRADLIVQGKKFSDYVLISSIFSNLFDDYSMTSGHLKGRIMAHLHLMSLTGKIKVACSDYVQEVLRKWVNSDFIIIRNSVSYKKFSIPSNEEKIQNRKLLGIDTHKKVFIFVGVLIKRKDPLTTIEAFLESKVCKTGAAVLIVIGDGPLKKICEEICINKNSVLFMGNTAETLSYLHAADYYIASSRSEGLPTSVVEALSCGLIPILTKIQPHIEITNNFKKWNYLFEIGDNKKLTELIDNIISEDYSFLSLQSRLIVESALNSKIMSNQYQALYSIKQSNIL